MAHRLVFLLSSGVDTVTDERWSARLKIPAVYIVSSHSTHASNNTVGLVTPAIAGQPALLTGPDVVETEHQKHFSDTKFCEICNILLYTLLLQYIYYEHSNILIYINILIRVFI